MVDLLICSDGIQIHLCTDTVFILYVLLNWNICSLIECIVLYLLIYL